MYRYIYIYTIYRHASSLPDNCLSIQEAHLTDAVYMDKGSGHSRREPAMGHGYMPGMLWRGAFGVCFISFPSSPHLPCTRIEPRVSSDPSHVIKDPIPKVTHSFLEPRAVRTSQQASPGHLLLLQFSLGKEHPGICVF